MYLESVKLENVGPISSIEINCKFTNNSILPDPIILVGPNGCGKSYLTSSIVNPLISARSIFFENSEVTYGKSYMTKDTNQIRYETSHMFEEVKFTNGLQHSELTLKDSKQQFIKDTGNHLDFENFKRMADENYSNKISNFLVDPNKTEAELESSLLLYFPPNRFEDPVWLNKRDLNIESSFGIELKSNSEFHRHIVNYSSLRVNKDWLSKLFFDSFIVEKWDSVTTPYKYKQFTSENSYPATGLLIQIENFLKIMFDLQDDIQWHVGSRIKNQIGFKVKDKLITHDLFALSTGQVLLLNLFLSIIRDCDYVSIVSGQNIEDVQGIAVLEDIDLHLHPTQQFELLPKLIKYFPKIQFIATTHSPLFLTGMEKEYPDGGIQIVDVESGAEIESQMFSELQSTYFYFQESKFFKEKLQKFSNSTKECVVFVEGKTDRLYIKRAAELLGKKELLEKIEIIEARSDSKLNSLRSFGSDFFKALINKKCILLYDSDTNKGSENLDTIYVRCIKKFCGNPVTKGIENLFEKNTIDKIEIKFEDAIEHIKSETKKKIKWEKIEISDDGLKTKVCKWLCKNGDIDDFKNFRTIFKIIEDVITNKS